MSKWVTLQVDDGRDGYRSFDVDKEWLDWWANIHGASLPWLLDNYDSDDSRAIECDAILAGTIRKKDYMLVLLHCKNGLARLESVKLSEPPTQELIDQAVNLYGAKSYELQEIEVQ